MAQTRSRSLLLGRCTDLTPDSVRPLEIGGSPTVGTVDLRVLRPFRRTVITPRARCLHVRWQAEARRVGVHQRHLVDCTPHARDTRYRRDELGHLHSPSPRTFSSSCSRHMASGRGAALRWRSAWENEPRPIADALAALAGAVLATRLGAGHRGGAEAALAASLGLTSRELTVLDLLARASFRDRSSPLGIGYRPVSKHPHTVSQVAPVTT